MRPVGGRETRALLLQPVHTEAQEEYDPREQQRAACAQQLRPAGLDEAGVAHGMIVDALAAKRMGEVVVRPLSRLQTTSQEMDRFEERQMNGGTQHFALRRDWDRTTRRDANTMCRIAERRARQLRDPRTRR